MSPEDLLDRGLAALDLQLPQGAWQNLLLFVDLLAKWNRVYNLTSVRKPQDMVIRHILDSLVILPYLHGTRVLDVGTGAGLPGIPLAASCPERHFTLLDSSAKKLRFVKQSVADLDLTNVDVVHSRIEDYQPAARFDTIVCRAYSSLDEVFRQTAALLAPGGRLLAMKGVYPVAEVESLADPGAVVEVIPLQVPLLDAQRHLVIMAANAA